MDAILSTRRRALLALGALALAGCGRRGNSAAGYLHFGGATMGSVYTVRLKAAAGQETALRTAVQAALDDVDARMSMFRAESELSALNRAPAGTAFNVSGDLHEVLASAQRVNRWSGGAFDVTVAPLVERWGFGTRRVREVPSAAATLADRARVGAQALVLEEQHRVIKRLAGLQVDLGGIAKGYGVDRAATALETLGVTDFMIEVGGEVRTRGVNASGEPWRIGIEEPDALPQRARWVVGLSSGAMATSGDYRNYFIEGGQRYSHEIDPISGAPIRHALCSVSVVADTCIEADALATALIVMGAEKGRALAERTGVAAHFIERAGEGFRDAMTPAFAALSVRRA